jgi:hypothetical protein
VEVVSTGSTARVVDRVEVVSTGSTARVVDRVEVVSTRVVEPVETTHDVCHAKFTASSASTTTSAPPRTDKA